MVNLMAAKKSNNVYSELNDLHMKASGLVDEMESVVTAYKTHSKNHSIADKEKTETMVETISKDIVEYREKVAATYNEHKGWTGKPKRDTRFMECHSIGMEYLNIITSITSATVPMALDVLNAISVEE